MIYMKVLRWVASRSRTHSDASSRWGHYYENLVDNGMIKIEDSVVTVGASRRDTHNPIVLTDKGREALSQ